MVACRFVFAFACVVAVLAAVDVAAQDAQSGTASTPAPSQQWEELTLGNGLQILQGDSDVVAWSSSTDWLEQFKRNEIDLTVNATLQRAAGHWSDTVNANWVGRWISGNGARGRFYPMTHVWIQRDEAAGVDLRATGGAGIGTHPVSRSNVRLTVEGGLGHTVERLRDRDETYVTVFLSSALRWIVSPRASIVSHSTVYLNGKRARDVRTNSELDLNLQITKRVGLQNQVLYFGDNEPVAGFKPRNLQASMNLAFSLTRGNPLQP